MQSQHKYEQCNGALPHREAMFWAAWASWERSSSASGVEDGEEQDGGGGAGGIGEFKEFQLSGPQGLIFSLLTQMWTCVTLRIICMCV